SAAENREEQLTWPHAYLTARPGTPTSQAKEHLSIGRNSQKYLLRKTTQTIHEFHSEQRHSH
ncbi:hypothetical protein AVEN_29872-1, partial [Araneus ventricosus]